MRYYGMVVGGNPEGVVRFDEDNVMTSYWDFNEKKWVDDPEFMAIVLDAEPGWALISEADATALTEKEPEADTPAEVAATS